MRDRNWAISKKLTYCMLPYRHKNRLNGDRLAVTPDGTENGSRKNPWLEAEN
ncbi:MULTISPECIES: hypothetical protein [Spirulina sp. CCY15215]|uniref:hypothetical protein n=1 Tax=Spirulina sp. CCY15215 TaxID=2767591 RepID=UPI00195122EC|nr:hypothetical protein [Spirulina major]